MGNTSKLFLIQKDMI